MPRRTALAAIALGATVSVLAGCGGGSNASGTANSSQSPQVELTSAVSSLGDAQTVTATLKLGATGSQLLQFVKAQDPHASLTPAQANAIAGAQMTFEVTAPSGKNLSDLTGLSNAGASDISITDNGKKLLSFRFVDQSLYLQADLKDFLNTIGQASTYQQLAAASSQLPSFAQALVEGKWVSLSMSTLKSLGSQFGASTPPSPNSAQTQKLLGKLQQLLTKDVTVTRTSSGSTDQLKLSANLRTLVADVTSGVASAVPGAGAALNSTTLSDVPDRTVDMSATVSDGALSSLTLDLGQLAKHVNGTLPLTLSFERSGPEISKPSGAVPVDMSSLAGLLGAFAGGMPTG